MLKHNILPFYSVFNNKKKHRAIIRVFTRDTNHGPNAGISNSFRIFYNYAVKPKIFPMPRRYHSRPEIYYSSDHFTPNKDNKKISTNENGLEVATPLGVTKSWVSHPKLLVETITSTSNGNNYFMSITHSMPPLSKFGADVKVIFCQQISNDLFGKPQYVIITNKLLPKKFIVNGGINNPLTEHQFGNTSEGLRNRKIIDEGVFALKNFVECNILHPSGQFYNIISTALKKNANDAFKGIELNQVDSILANIKASADASLKDIASIPETKDEK